MGMFDLIAGLRYDIYKLDGTFTANATNAFPLQLTPGQTYSVDQSEGRVDPKITLAARVTPWLQPYITYSESMRAPTINETMAGGSHPGGTSSFSPNPFLKPEVQKGWEFGANIVQNGVLARGDSFRLKADYYTMNVENYISACFTAGFTAYFCNAAGTSQVQGVEVQAMYDVRNAFAGLSYTYTNSNLPTQTNGFGAQSYLPDHVFVATGGLRFFEQKLTVGTRYTVTSSAYTGSDATVIANSFNGPIRTDGYQLVDLFASYKFDSGLELGVTANNIFDVTYMPALATPPTTVSCGTPAAAASAACQTGTGRTVLLTAKTQF
jgi:hemoglobin/transferrin/lactoferrin receptor protein